MRHGDRSVLILIVILLVISLSPVYGFLFDDDFVDEESGMSERAKLRKEFAEKEIDHLAIDIERDLFFSEVMDVAIVMISVFAIVIIVAILAALKTVNPVIIVIGLGAGLLFASIAGSIYMAEATSVLQLLSTNDNFWKEKKISSFDLEELTDMGEPEIRSSESNGIIRKLDLSSLIDPEILSNSTYYRWNKEKYEREVFILEFVNEVAAHSFIDAFFQPINFRDIRQYRARYGVLDTRSEDYRRTYLMAEERFVILSFGTEMHAMHAMNRVLNNFPEDYWIDDNQKPLLEVIEPSGNTEENVLVLNIEDTLSGINPMSLKITNIEKEIDPLMSCRENRTMPAYTSFTCEFEDVLIEGSNSISIVASDNSMNNADANVEYQLSS